MEKQLEALRKALEMGARIDIHLHDNSDLDEAKEKVKIIADIIQSEMKYYEVESGTNWFSAGDSYFKVSSYGPNKK